MKPRTWWGVSELVGAVGGRTLCGLEEVVEPHELAMMPRTTMMMLKGRTTKSWGRDFQYFVREEGARTHLDVGMGSHPLVPASRETSDENGERGDQQPDDHRKTACKRLSSTPARSHQGSNAP